jgi:hypothetical protein
VAVAADENVGDRYGSQFTSTWKNLSRPARTGVTVNVNRGNPRLADRVDAGQNVACRVNRAEITARPGGRVPARMRGMPRSKR